MASSKSQRDAAAASERHIGACQRTDWSGTTQKKRTTISVILLPDEGGLVFAILISKGQSIRFTNAVEHGIDRNCNTPVVQHGFVAGPALEPASHFGRCLCTARTSRLFVRSGIRTIHVHSTSMCSVSCAIRTVPQNDSFEPLPEATTGTTRSGFLT